MYYVYSLKCRDGYYVGCTDNIENRLDRHQKGYVQANSSRLPVILNFYFAVTDKYQGFRFEKYLKSGSGRVFLNKHFKTLFRHLIIKRGLAIVTESLPTTDKHHLPPKIKTASNSITIDLFS